MANSPGQLASFIATNSLSKEVSYEEEERRQSKQGRPEHVKACSLEKEVVIFFSELVQ